MKKNHVKNQVFAHSGNVAKICLIAVVLFLFVQVKAEAQQKIQKDERLGVILSLSAPGFGQIYAGKTWRGIGIIAAEAVSFGVVAAVSEKPKKITVQDYDTGDTYEIWSRKNKKLSGGEVAAVVSAVVAGAGIYVWQLFDARNCVRDHNKAQGFDVGMTIMQNGRPGVNVRLDF